MDTGFVQISKYTTFITRFGLEVLPSISAWVKKM